ncbi:MAG TPA: hypothetical protein PK605_07205 [Ignavibacteria bacterium]|nr:hypothetical protein [Ignavibacteria bacterium]HRE09406.1 hypothetical protein [Ignavibacteria bacterium]HRF64531.1 hypothetical protein [Ignavibacteria bacterium]HRJ04173.1 hypothetical protein [Ignavibacteria bacterium]HRJ84493.1 hypothetical protein [Ignavibacteria bacterium]
MGQTGRISIEKYAELCAKMGDIINDNEACVKIAESSGYSRAEWNSAHTRWQKRITDPEDMGKTASKFVECWQDEVKKLRTNGDSAGNSLKDR